MSVSDRYLRCVQMVEHHRPYVSADPSRCRPFNRWRAKRRRALRQLLRSMGFKKKVSQ